MVKIVSDFRALAESGRSVRPKSADGSADGQGVRIVVAHPSADLYGSDRMLLESVTALREAAAQVVVVLPAHGPLVNELENVGAVVTIATMGIVRKSALTPRGFGALVIEAFPAVLKAIALIRGSKADILYVNTQVLPLWPLVGRVMRRRTLVHVHEGEENAPRVLRLALAAPAFFANQVIANSRFSQKVLSDSFPVLKGKTIVVHNGVAGPQKPVRAPREMLSGALRLIYVGRISHRKGVDLAVSALIALRSSGLDVELDIVGAIFPGNEDYQAGLERQIEQGGVESHVRWHGFQSDVWGALEAADVVLVTSRLDESFGNVAIEAVLAQRPAVVSAIPGLQEASEGFNSIAFVPPNSVAALAESVEQIYLNWGAWRQESIRDSATAAEKYGPKRYRAALSAAVLGIGARQRTGSTGQPLTEVNEE